METDKLSETLVEEVIEFTRIGNEAVQKAQEENRRRGIPNAYSLNGVIYYQLPDGTITMEDPWDSSIEQQQDDKNERSDRSVNPKKV